MNKQIRIIITYAVLILSGLLIYYFRFHSVSSGFGSYFFNHSLYIPVILTAFWWQFRVIPVIIYLVTLLICADIFSGHRSLIFIDLINALFFTAAGITVSYFKNILTHQLHLKIYRDILYSIQEAVVIIDRSFNIILNNDSFNRIFNVSKNEISNIDLLFNNDLKMKEFQENALRSFCGESVFMGVYLHDEQEEGNYYLINFYPLKNESGINNLILSFSDISEQKKNEMIQKKASDRQRLSIEVLELINRDKTDSDLINDILTLIRGKTGIDALVINLRSGEQYCKFASMSLLDKIKGSSGVNHTKPESKKTKNAVIAGFDESFCSRIAGDSLFWTNNLAGHYMEQDGKSGHSAVFEHFLSCAIIPLKNGNELMGYFMLLDSRENFFDQELIFFYQGLVESIELALNRIANEANLRNMINEKGLLIKEIHHRVKNNMQVIISLISLQASRQDDDKVRDILNDCQNRVRTMALVHEKLYSSENFTSININAYIRSLVPMLMTSYKVDKAKIYVEINAFDTYFSLNTAIPLAQLVNEILSNSFKHAFVNRTEGSVKISLSPEDGVPNRYMLTISDNGGGLPSGVTYPEEGNLGFQLIDALSKQLKGKIAFSGEGGVSIKVLFSDN